MIFGSEKLVTRIKDRAYIYRAWVVENDDPMKLGRVKCQCPFRWGNDQPIEKLPWIFPLNPFGSGGKKTNSSFEVPEIDSELLICFPFDDEYVPFYIGYVQSTLTHQEELFDVSYPETYGKTDSQMQWIRVNKEEGWTEWYHTCKFTCRLYDDGNMHIHIPKNLHILIDEDLLVKVKGKEVWEIDKTSSKQVLQDTVLEVGEDYSVRVKGNSFEDTYGNFSRHVYGEFKSLTDLSYSEEIMLDHKSKINQNKYLNVLLDYNTLVEQNQLSHIKLDRKELVDKDKYSTVKMNRYEVTEFNFHHDVKLNEHHKSAQYHRKGDVLITEDAPQIHHNSGLSRPPEKQTADDPSIDAPVAADPTEALIGHGKLAQFVAELIAKYEELKALEERVKALEDEAKPERIENNKLHM